jgi:hypothetical protein
VNALSACVSVDLPEPARPTIRTDIGFGGPGSGRGAGAGAGGGAPGSPSGGESVIADQLFLQGSEHAVDAEYLWEDSSRVPCKRLAIVATSIVVLFLQRAQTFGAMRVRTAAVERR